MKKSRIVKNVRTLIVDICQVEKYNIIDICQKKEGPYYAEKRALPPDRRISRSLVLFAGRGDENETLTLSLDEFEGLRLLDREGLTQKNARKNGRRTDNGDRHI